MALVARNTCIRWRGASCSALRGQLDVLAHAARQAGDDRTLHFAGHGVDGFPVPARGRRKARLDDIHAEFGQRARDAQLLRLRHAAARRLFAIAQRGVEDQYSVGVGVMAVSVQRAPLSQGMRARSFSPTRSIGWRRSALSRRRKFFAPALALANPLPGKLAALNLLEDLAHFLLGVRIDHARAAREITVLGGVADESGASSTVRPRAAGRRSV
jgi:hypothetical protein